MKTIFLRGIAILILTSILVVGCGSPASTQVDPQRPAASPTLAEQVLATAEQPRQGLLANDPAQVNLESGDLQLVEFFAFW